MDSGGQGPLPPEMETPGERPTTPPGFLAVPWTKKPRATRNANRVHETAAATTPTIRRTLPNVGGAAAREMVGVAMGRVEEDSPI